MVLDLTCGQLHRVADIPLCVSHFECAPVFWLTSSISVATRPFESELSWLSLLHRLTMQRYNIFRAIPNFTPRFGAIFSTNLTNWCFQHRRCSCSAKLMQAWLCTRLIASFERTVISSPRIRNFRPSKITFRRWRSMLRASFYSHNRHIVTM